MRCANLRRSQREWLSAFGMLVCLCGFGLVPAGHGQTDPVSQLIGDLNDTRWVVRLDAAFALSRIKDPRTVEPLIAALSDSDPDVRRTAATALGQNGDLRAVNALIESLQDAEAQVRNGAVEALGKIGDTRAIEPLFAALRDTDAEVRRRAADCLGHFGDPRAVDPLLAALRDPEANVRLVVARALDLIKDPRANEPLILALKEKEKPIVSGAYKFFIGRGEAGSEAILAAALDQFGNKDMALDYLNCGNPKLASAGRAWATRNGYLIVADPDGATVASVLWGSERPITLSSSAR